MAKTGRTDGGQRGDWWRIALWGGAGLALATPLVAMQFTEEVQWTWFDFAVFGGMLIAACGAFELAARASGNIAYRAGFAIAIGAAFLMVWANLGVGIIGNEENPANLMYYGVLAVGLVGAVVARLRPGGMARALIATAIAQGAVALIALVAGYGQTFVLTGIFVALWLTSARLFRKARG